MIRKKICMLGSYAVGKTSLVVRYVRDMFSDRYQTTIGVKILKKELTLDGQDVNLLLWDLHGDDDFQALRTSYLRGAAGYLLVADGTRADTLTKAEELHDIARAHLGDVPFALLVNKHDLQVDWELATDFDRRLLERDWTVIRTSALSGEGVEAAFVGLARRMVHD